MHSYVAEARHNIRCDPLVGVTWRRNVSGTSCKLLQEDVTTYQERLASHLTKMLRRSRKVLQVTWRSCSNVSGTSCKLLQEELQRIRNIWQVSYRICYIVAGTFCKFLVCAQEDERYYPTPPHPTPLEHEWEMIRARKWVTFCSWVRKWGVGLKGPHVPAPCPQVLP